MNLCVLVSPLFAPLALSVLGAGTVPPPPSDIVDVRPASMHEEYIPREEKANRLTTIADDPAFRLVLHAAHPVITNDGRQPFLFRSARGTLFCQTQLNTEPFHSKRKIVFPHLMGSAISRDNGATWTRWTHQEGHDDVNVEGGIVQCADGTILLFDTFVIPSPKGPNYGLIELWKSHDDLRTFEGPFSVQVALPGVNFVGTSDDSGRPHEAVRLHRSVLELPNGDLLATMYGWFTGDTAPAAYIPSMKKARVFIVRSQDHGASWAFLSTVAVDGGVGTEGFCEAAMVRITQGPCAGRLLCEMRTGRDLYGCHSEDNGLTWSRAVPTHFPGIDIYDTVKWKSYLTDPKAIETDGLIGDVVDPDLIEMADGTIVCAVGVRVSARGFMHNWRAPQNGDYLAFSRDGGDTWTHIVQFRSGAPTTQYMGVREISPGVLYVVYEDSVWHMPGAGMGFRLDVKRLDRSAR